MTTEKALYVAASMLSELSKIGNDAAAAALPHIERLAAKYTRARARRGEKP